MSRLKADCPHHEFVEKIQMYPSTITRVLRWLGRTGDRFRAVHWPDSFEFDTPAVGDGYDFSVTVHFTWCVTGHAYGEVLVARAEEHRDSLLERTVARIRGVSRGFAAYEVGDAENKVHRVIGELFTGTRLSFVSATGTDGDARPIEHRTILRLDKPVREAQRAAWSERQNAVNEHALARLLVTQFGERRQLWQEFLQEGRNDWLTPYAVALAKDPGAVAEIVEKMNGDRREQAKELANQVVDQAVQYEERDAFDLMLQNDRVLRHLMELIGVPGLPPPAPSPFEEP
jgi:hypothetical protein